MDQKQDRKSAARTARNKPPEIAPDDSLSVLQAVKLPTQDLPLKMLVAIDGWAHSGKNTTGELVAEAIGGVLVDSGRFYRAFTRACVDAGIDLDNEHAVACFCWAAALDVRLRKEGGRVAEAQVCINGNWYSKEELKGVGTDVSKTARVYEVREKVNHALRLCENYGRVVMLGRDIGGVVIPETPFKFFLDAPEYVRERRHRETTGKGGALERDQLDESRVVFADDALMVDTHRLQPGEVRGVIIIELFWRATDRNIVRHTV